MEKNQRNYLSGLLRKFYEATNNRDCTDAIYELKTITNFLNIGLDEKYGESEQRFQIGSDAEYYPVIWYQVWDSESRKWIVLDTITINSDDDEEGFEEELFDDSWIDIDLEEEDEE